MTDQEVFTKVATHLLTQNAKSTDVTGSCKYRGVGGLKCAIGCLIPDELYDPSDEGKTVWQLMQPGCGALHSPGDDPRTLMLCTLQALHDVYTVEYWREELQTIANAFGLEMPTCVS